MYLQDKKTAMKNKENLKSQESNLNEHVQLKKKIYAQNYKIKKLEIEIKKLTKALNEAENLTYKGLL